MVCEMITKNEITNRLIQCFERIGIIVNEGNFDISEEVEDSLMFVSMIVEIEQEFGIEIPDEYFGGDRLVSFHDIENMIESIIKTRG